MVFDPAEIGPERASPQIKLQLKILSSMSVVTNKFLKVVLFIVIGTCCALIIFINQQHQHHSTAGVRRMSIKNETDYKLWNNTRWDETKYSFKEVQPFTFDPDDKDWPPLDRLIADKKQAIKADVQFMLDFAIIGHPKTATTFIMTWLASHREIAMHKKELHAMQSGNPAELISLLYELPAGRNYKRGYKAPRDIVNLNALKAFDRFFPETKLIIGLRHPVLWFESFYNFRVRHKYTMPPAELLIGSLRIGMNGVCTDESRFHEHLDHLGKTPHSMEEIQLLTRPHSRPRMYNPVFLYEINQLHDENTTRAQLYRTDLKHYLGLKFDLEPIHVTSTSNTTKQVAINICDFQYRFVRTELMKNAVTSSLWIQQYFLQSPDVFVSSPQYFVELLQNWMIDPCTERT